MVANAGSVLFFGLFFGLFGMAFLWLVLCQRLFRKLEAHDPAVFSAMGEPHVITNNTPRQVGPFFKLLYSDAFPVGHPPTKRLIRIMRVYLLVYLVGFVGLVGLLFLGSVVAA